MVHPVLLINTNILRPPVSPVGLEHVGEALREAGVMVDVLDLAFETDWKEALARRLKNEEPLMVGLSVRNADDSCYATRHSFLPWIREVVTETRLLTQAPVLLGGGGFSTMPETILWFTQADAGIAGDGELALPAIAERLIHGWDFSDLPSVVHRSGNSIIANTRHDVDLRRLPPPRRRLFDNRKYQETGAMVGIETKRGCNQRCIFCADPVAKGRRQRLRPPAVVAREFQDLIDQGVSWFHLCDSEFNLPVQHAKDVCRSLIAAGLGDKVRWYTYCAPAPFDAELAGLMKRAGCAGINFGVDCLSDQQLIRLGRNHRVADLERLTGILAGEGLNYIFDLLLGGPGETEQTVKESIEQTRRLNIPLTGIAAGLRLYPGTPLARAVEDGAIAGTVEKAPGHLQFYVSPALGGGIMQLVAELVAGDPRYLFLAAPSGEASYNYAGDETLAGLIAKGARGAYWDILKRNTSM